MRRVIITICAIAIIILIIFNRNAPDNVLAREMKEKYSEIKSVTRISVGPTSTIMYHIKPDTPLEICESIFYDTINGIKRDKLYSYLFKTHKGRTGQGIVRFKVEFTTKDEEKPSYGLIAEFNLVGAPPTPSAAEAYDWDEAVWECVDSLGLPLGKYKYQQKNIE